MRRQWGAPLDPGNRPQLTELPPGELQLVVRTSDGFEARAQAQVVAGQTRTVILKF